MRTLGTLLSSAAALALVCGGAGDAAPTKQFTRPCELSGDAAGGGEVGVKAWSWGPLTMAALQGDLASLFTEAGLDTEENTEYYGPGRVGDTRLDFSFDVPASNCGSETCQFRLILLNGVYNRNAEEVVFAEGTEALLYDTHALTSEGTANLVVQFTDGGGGETGPEKTAAACSDGKDNDGDGLIDCADPNCKKVCP